MKFDQWLDKPIHGGSGPIPTRRAYYSDNQLTAARDAWGAATAAEREDAQRLALERITHSYRLLLAGKPVRDADETLAEADAAIRSRSEK